MTGLGYTLPLGADPVYHGARTAGRRFTTPQLVAGVLVGPRTNGRRASRSILTAAAATEPCPPRVLSARATSSTTVRVFFDRAMQPGPLRTASNFSLAGTISRTVIASAVPAECGDPTFADLTLSGEMTQGGGNYTITVAGGVRDSSGAALAAGARSAIFDGLGISPVPTGASSAATEITHVTVRFSELLEQASAETTSNYTYAPAAGVAVLSGELQPDGRTVVLTVTGQVAGETYTLTVVGVKDLAGNPVR